MTVMTVHLVGGFLGSGKTTAIRSACELLRQRGEAASVITNDQGTLLVDTAYLRGSQPTREVTGGCFCCRYDQLAELLAQARCDGTQHVFAEAVGSCADLVATVVRPLLGSPSGPVGSRVVHGDGGRAAADPAPGGRAAAVVQATSRICSTNSSARRRCWWRASGIW